MGALVQRVVLLEQAAKASGSSGVQSGSSVPVQSGQGASSRRAMEHKAVMNMKVQGSDRSGYRMWHEKLVNAFAQVNAQYRSV